MFSKYEHLVSTFCSWHTLSSSRDVVQFVIVQTTITSLQRGLSLHFQPPHIIISTFIEHSFIELTYKYVGIEHTQHTSHSNRNISHGSANKDAVNCDVGVCKQSSEKPGERSLLQNNSWATLTLYRWSYSYHSELSSDFGERRESCDGTYSYGSLQSRATC